MKTIDLSYDFLKSCGDEFEDIKATIESINLDSEMDKIEFLKKFITESKNKYTKAEAYLRNRID